jgi:hypothetical protein
MKREKTGAAREARVHRRGHRILLGWREWVALPGLRVPAVKAKIDTGARTSALHAEDIRIVDHAGVTTAQFRVFPLQRTRRGALVCEAPVVDRRMVTDSGGHREERWVIRTTIRLAGDEWDTEISLTNRDAMSFRMLLGRATLGRRFLIHPSASFLMGRSADPGAPLTPPRHQRRRR